MSVLFKGIDMPKNCLDCPVISTEYGFCQGDKEERHGYIGHDDRPSWCPLMEVPEPLKKDSGFYGDRFRLISELEK